MQAIIGQKVSQTQKFLEDGRRIPVTAVNITGGNIVVQSKTKDKEGYDAIQVGFGNKKNGNKPLVGHVKGASLTKAPLFLREVEIEGELPAIGAVIKASDVFKPGDIVDVIGVSKGKGYAGGVKRHNFKGGPRTHGQSDRERAPGSIGQSTTPGRVYKGKRMAGRMGHARVTVANLMVVDVTDDGVLIKGLVPGPVNNLIMIKKVGEAKKFTPLYKEEVEGEKVEEVIEPVIEEAPTEEASAEAASEVPVEEIAAKPESQEEVKPEESTEGKKEEVVSSDTKVMEDKENAS